MDEDSSGVAAVARGDRRAFARLYAKYHGRLHAFAVRVTGRPDLADDVVNEAMLGVWTGAARFEGRAKVSTWIFGICYRCGLTALSRQRRGEASATVEDVSDVVPAPRGEGSVAHIFDRASVERALAMLTPEQRAVVELTYFHGHSTREVAEIVGCPVGTVKTRMFAARHRMRAALEPEDGDETSHG